ncbi:c-type lysozyme inhibitor [Paracoccus jiaweipingae]|uniref:c-type lysozyme inhibitor n=1 Tax=unclassified Paracoccus (in: a-proteobacteria) TaxID=2688777 RepID=UPI0037958355
MKMLAATTIAALSLAGAAHADTGKDEVSQVKYACAGNAVLDVVYVNTAAGNSYAIISQMDELIPMQITPMASGASYAAMDANYTYRLDTKGDNATLVTVDGDKDTPVLSDCTASE